MFFFDTYAIIEIWNGNTDYQKYANETIITSMLNLGELYYSYIKDGSKESADLRMDTFKPNIIEIDKETMKKAMYFRYIHKKRKLSMVDCVGYMLSQKIGIPFLTGDKEFKDFPNVEFVK